MPRVSRTNPHPAAAARRSLNCAARALAVAVLLLAYAPTVHAEPRVQAYIVIEAPDSYDMGSVASFHGAYQPDNPLTVRVAANIPHNGLTVSISPLTHENSAHKINTSQIEIRHHLEPVWARLDMARNITGPMGAGKAEIGIQLRVRDLDFNYSPGTYSGVLTLTLSAD